MTSPLPPPSRTTRLTLLAALSLVALSFTSPTPIPISTRAGNTYILSAETGRLRLVTQHVSLSSPTPSLLPPYTFRNTDPGQLIVYRGRQREGLMTFPLSPFPTSPLWYDFTTLRLPPWSLGRLGPTVAVTYRSFALPT